MFWFMVVMSAGSKVEAAWWKVMAERIANSLAARKERRASERDIPSKSAPLVTPFPSWPCLLMAHLAMNLSMKESTEGQGTPTIEISYKIPPSVYLRLLGTFQIINLSSGHWKQNNATVWQRESHHPSYIKSKRDSLGILTEVHWLDLFFPAS